MIRTHILSIVSKLRRVHLPNFLIKP